MRHLPSDNYNVAWFKLAEFVTRGEKERALSMYRLLMHSINNKALSLQLEGDLLNAFNDIGAYEKYRAAAQCYLSVGCNIEAICVYEHLKLMGQCSLDDLRAMIQLYKELEYVDRLMICLQDLSIALMESNFLDQAISLIQEYSKNLTASHIGLLYFNIINFLITSKKSKTVLTDCLATSLRNLIESSADHALQAFLVPLEAMHPSVYQDALLLLEEL